MTPRGLQNELYAVERSSLKAIPYIPRRSPYIRIVRALHAREITVNEYVRLREKLKRFYKVTNINDALS